MSANVSQITSISTVWSAVCSGAYQRRHQSSAWLNFMRGIHRSPVDSPYNGPVTRKMLPFDDVIRVLEQAHYWLRQWLVGYSKPSCFLKKAVVLPILLNFETKWDSIQHNAFQNVIVKMCAILFRHRYLLMWLLTIWYVYLDWHFEESYIIVNAESGTALLLACTKPLP